MLQYESAFHMRMKYILLLAILIVIYSCEEKPQGTPGLKGVWNTIGYGKQFVVTDSIVEIYHLYEGGCSFDSQMPKDLFEKKYPVTRLTIDSLTIHVGITNYNFRRSNSKSAFCEKNFRSENPIVNFDALWNTFNEYYPSFELRGIDWQKSREKYRSRLDTRSTDLELYTVLYEMTSELNDGHVRIEIPENLENLFGKHHDEMKGLRDEVISKINTKYVQNLKTYNKGNLNWGIIDGNIGYIQINAFDELANYAIDNNLPRKEFWETYKNKAGEYANPSAADLNGIKQQMPKIFDDIKHTNSCILDVRFNGGGWDAVGLEVLSYFTKNKVVAFTKKAKLKNGFTKLQTIFLEPNSNVYNGHLFILTSPQTASAAETFVIASLNLPNSTTIGSNTEGMLSDINDKKLPNGWEYGLSSEIYLSADGVNYEKIGVPPDFELNYPQKAKEFYNSLSSKLKKEDKAIEKVKEMSK